MYEVNQILGSNNLKYLCEAESKLSCGNWRRFAYFKCHCGNEFVGNICDVKLNKITSCGCLRGNKKFEYETGQLINGVKFIESLGTVNQRHFGLFECPICKKDWKSSIGLIKSGLSKSCCDIGRGWKRTQWIEKYKTAILYKVLLFNDNESFIKIGMTSKTVEHRMSKIKEYDYKILKEIHGESGYIYDLENRIKRVFKKQRYFPNKNFKGETECFTYK